MRRSFPAVTGLLIVNFAVFLAPSFVRGLDRYLIENFALYFPANAHFKSWQLVTHMFMHGSVMHIAFNMFALYAFGRVMEQLWGARRYLVFYFLCGVGAAAIYLLTSWIQAQVLQSHLVDAGVSTGQIETYLRLGRLPPGYNPQDVKDMLGKLSGIYTTPMVGASGALYGVLIAFAMLFPNAKLALIFLPVPIAAKYFIPAILALDLFSGVTGIPIFGLGGNVAHFAHLGGAAIGFLLMMVWRRRDRPRTSVWHA